ncbi:hypothetical protein MH215_26660 [Paenibacillus sp. ACRSA]|uniref:hypothetical protein n=1 Tax=Paenibacillus sp. ACRSA TaxID=2918211 RepID=UPI001EF57563|nr:hypothetical protein [Paenibacillus sp. ACRSA]MCG7380564.1 hypothetical protein [Paenibacillus sp. ACRSA]
MGSAERGANPEARNVTQTVISQSFGQLVSYQIGKVTVSDPVACSISSITFPLSDAKGYCQLAKQKKSYGAGVFVPGSRNREVAGIS